MTARTASEVTPEKYVYDHIPTLKELLPEKRGLPGVEYAQVTTDNLWLAQQNDWSKLSGKQKLYTIRGPQGEVHCELYGKGKPIKGQSSKGGKRICWIDKLIKEKTGCGLKDVADPLPEPTPEPLAENKTTVGDTPKSVADKGIKK